MQGGIFYALNAGAKIRILSNIFTIFASWTIKSIKVIKRAIKIFWRTIVSIVSILFATALLIQLPQVQTYVADKVVHSVSDKIDADISFEKIHLKPFTTLVLKNVLILDRNPIQDPIDSTSVKIDTFFRAGYIIAKFSLDGLLKHEGLHFDKAFVGNAQMNLVIEDNPDPTGRKTTDNLSRIFRLKKQKPVKNEKEIFHIRKVEISDMSFAMKIYESGREIYGDEGIDWNDLDVRDINLSARELQYKGGIMTGELDRLSFREKSGYLVEKISGKAKVGRGKAIITDLSIDDLWSDVHLPLYMMSFNHVDDFQNFIGKVRIDGQIETSMLDFETLSYFAPELKDNHLKAYVSGSMSGYVDDFRFSDVRIDMISGGFSGRASGRISGLPDIGNTYLDAHLNGFRITTAGIGNFISEWIPGDGKLDIGRYADGTSFRLDASGRGMFNNLNIKADLSSDIGSLDADVILKDMVSGTKPLDISGSIRTDDLNLGRIFGTELLGKTTLSTTLGARLGQKDQPAELVIESLKIDKLNANHYDYTNIAAVGNISSDIFDGRIVCHDPNLNFLLQGTFALSSKTNNARYKFFTNIGHADLNAINIDKRGISKVNLRASADFTKTGKGDLRGRIDIGDLMLENSMGRYDIGDINLNSYSSDGTYTTRLDSKFAYARYTGSAPMNTFISELRDITLKQELPSLFADTTYVWKGNSYNLEFKASNSIDLLTFIMPGLYVDEGTSLTASLDKEGRLEASLSSNRLAFEKNYLKGIDARFDNEYESLRGLVSCEEMRMAGMMIMDSHLDLHGDEDHLGIRFDFENSGDLINKGEIILHNSLSRNTDGLQMATEILPSSVILNSKEWHLQPSDFVISKDLMDVGSFTISSGEEQISLRGKASHEPGDTLTLNLDRLDVSPLNEVMKTSLDIKGAVTGTVSITSPLSEKGILADIICDSVSVAGTPLGILSIGSILDDFSKEFKVFLKNEYNGKSTIDVYGAIAADGSDINADILLDGFKVNYFQPLLPDVFSVMDGSISGRLALEGPPSALKIRSHDTRIENTQLNVAYTDVPYFADGRFHADETGVYFDNIYIRDSYTGSGHVNGGISWDHFKDIRFDTHIDVRDIEGINISEEKAESFYGRVFGTGNVSITGPVNSLLMSIDAVTAKTGQLHIPLNSEETAGRVTNLLRFTEKENNVRIDPYEAMMTKLDAGRKDESDFRIKLRVNAQPEVEAFVEIDKASGNVLSGRGSGIIDIVADDESFNINGDYTISSGNYRFVAMGLVSRDFQIEDGSSIKFNGDIMESTLDINAVYRTKASLSTLLSDESSVSNKRNVNCGISITDKLLNPKLGFSIQIPDINPMIKSRVESALSSEDKVQKQFLSLIVSNNFLPDEQSGIVNNSSVLYTNVTEILANQLNTIFHKLDIPLDLGLNYQPNESGNDIFDVAVSTQLFNNRVVVNGNIGNKQYSTTGSQNDVVGDLDIEIKLNRPGSLRLNLFSHSADQFSNYLDNSQRNGVGIMYQTEFNSFRRFFRSIFTGKAKRQAAKMQEEQAMLQGGRNEISIERP